MKRTCQETEARLYEFLDHELGFMDRWRIRRHLRRCPPCQSGASFENRLRHKIRAGCADEIPEELWNRIRTFIRHNGVTDASAEPTAGGSDV
jgi:mycothiol system anti-sigma-R factor